MYDHHVSSSERPTGSIKLEECGWRLDPHKNGGGATCHNITREKYLILPRGQGAPWRTNSDASEGADWVEEVVRRIAVQVALFKVER